MTQDEGVNDKLAVLLGLSAQLAGERDLKTILLRLTDITKLLLGADRCSIFLHDGKRRELWTIVAHGVEEIRIPDTQGIAGHTFRTEEVVNLADAQADPRHDKAIDRRTGYSTKTLLAMPLVDMNGTSIGVFQVINRLDGSPFGTQEIDLLRHVSLYAASTIESALLYDRLERAHEDAVYRLSHATKFKDPETQNHIIRVGLYCAVLARKLGWSREEVRIMRLAAPMHDIGKVGIPDLILQKPLPLDDSEWQTMKRHTTYGHDILRNGESHLLEVAAQVALEHHEKWDGTGYPNGLSGSDISTHGRMTALADVFDALTSERHYKKAWPIDRVLSLFREERGRHFDPELDDLFLASVDEITAIRQEFSDE